jgi:hypothetical protein
LSAADIARSLGAVARIRFGPGVPGRIGTPVMVSVVALTCAAAIAVWKAPLIGLVFAGFAFLSLMTHIILSYIFAFRHPDVASLESADYVQMRSQASVTVNGAVLPQRLEDATENPAVIEGMAQVKESA